MRLCPVIVQGVIGRDIHIFVFTQFADPGLGIAGKFTGQAAARGERAGDGDDFSADPLLAADALKEHRHAGGVECRQTMHCFNLLFAGFRTGYGIARALAKKAYNADAADAAEITSGGGIVMRYLLFFLILAAAGVPLLAGTRRLRPCYKGCHGCGKCMKSFREERSPSEEPEEKI
jgi:hypothetical protein